ncbi:MAG: Hemolysin-type calcium-binding region [Nocardioides sp.]|nr:Hemolysin-type calcium-binding region [Nocardioides sp.]
MQLPRTSLALTSFLAALALTIPTAYAADIPGTSGDDVLHGTRGDDTIRGGAGNDVIDGRRGHDVLDGGSGDDRLSDYKGVGSGDPIDTTRDVFRGGPGRDTLSVGHNDVVHAGPGADQVWAYYVGEGDLIDCGAGADVLHLHEDLHGLETRGCETILTEYAG